MPRTGSGAAAAPAPQVPPNGEPAQATAVSLGIMGHTKRLLRIALGFILLTIAAFFGLVPFVPGWPLGILGLSILAAEFVWARRLMKRLRKGGVRLRDALWPRRSPRRPRRGRTKA